MHRFSTRFNIELRQQRLKEKEQRQQQKKESEQQQKEQKKESEQKQLEQEIPSPWYTTNLIYDKPVTLDQRSQVYGGSFHFGTTWDKPLVELTYEMIKSIDNCVFLDIGASTGSFTLLAKYLQGGIMYSFEPHPLTFDILRSNVKLNDLTDKCHLYNVALVDSVDSINKGPMTLKFPVNASGQLSGSGLATLGNPLRFNNYQAVEVKADTLDRIIEESKLTKLDFIKIDTEGYEYYILKGGLGSIKKYKPHILMEFNETNMAQCKVKKEQILGLLKELGYSYKFVAVEDILCTPT